MPIYEGGRLVNWTKGKSHHFHDHALTVEGVKSIEFIRERAKSPDGPGIYEMEHPDLEPVQDLLLELTTANVDRIREILTTERETAGRQVVIEACANVLDRMGVSESTHSVV